MPGVGGSPETGGVDSPEVYSVLFIVEVIVSVIATGILLVRLVIVPAARTIIDLIKLWKARLKPADIDALPAFTYRRPAPPTEASSAGGADDVECTVCLSPMREGQIVKLLPGCEHLFHVNCIDTWLHHQPTCPVCRAYVKSPKATACG